MTLKGQPAQIVQAKPAAQPGGQQATVVPGKPASRGAIAAAATVIRSTPAA